MATKKTAATAPAHLSAAGKRLWVDLQADFPLDDAAGKLILRSALEAFDRLQEASAILKKEGAVLRDRWGQAKPHPAVGIERDARNQMHSALRLLRLAPDALE